MRLDENIEEAAIRVCDAMAGASELYASISGSGLEDLPEHFISAHVFAALGSVLTITMETNSKKLWKRSCDTRRRWGGLPPTQLPPTMSPEYNPAVGGRKVDLVLFRGDHSKKSETDLLCLVEFKIYDDIEPDVVKIREWFRFLDTCPWGLACGFTTKIEWLRIVQDRAERAGDKFVKGRVARPLNAPDTHTYAQMLSNTNYKAPSV
jgi:hypothetical protein